MKNFQELVTKKAVVFGAGKMACGLIGELLYESGFQLLFVVRRQEVADALNRKNGYYVGIAGETDHWIRIRHCQSVLIDNTQAVVEAVAKADIVFTAVGIDNVPAISPLIADALVRRLALGYPPLNIIASENLPGTGAYLHHQIVGASGLGDAVIIDKSVGFSAALTHRIMTGGEIMDGVLHFTVDAPGDLLIDARGLVEPIPKIYHARITNEFDALFLEKLSTINLAQAVASYVGWRYGCKFVHEAAVHPQVAPIVEGALQEAVVAFKTEFPNLSNDIEQDANEAMARIIDPGLGDTVARIVRGPQRKLGAQERLVGPARLAIRHDLPYDNLALAIAAALTYQADNDLQSNTMQYLISTAGVDKILTDVCGILPHEAFAQTIKKHWATFVGKKDEIKVHMPDKIVQDMLRTLENELAVEYDRSVVKDILVDVAKEFLGAHISHYLPILIKKKAKEQLRGDIEPII